MCQRVYRTTITRGYITSNGSSGDYSIGYFGKEEPLINWHLSSEVFVKRNKFIWACRFRPETSTKRPSFLSTSPALSVLFLCSRRTRASWPLETWSVRHSVVFIGFAKWSCIFLYQHHALYLHLSIKFNNTI